MAERRVRWGLLSTARINARFIPAIHASKRSELLAIASRSKEKAAQNARAWSIPRAYGSYEGLLADPDIDAVHVSLPNSYHAAWTIKAAKSGKHVLCEKPLALTPEDADRMAAAAHRNGIVLQEAAMFRYHPQTLKVQEIVAGGGIGELRLVRGVLTTTTTAQHDIRLQPELGGGCLWDLGSYPVSFIRAVVGAEPVEVVGWQVLGDTGVDLTFAGQMRFATGALGQFSCSFQGAPHWEAELIGTHGMILLNFPWTHATGVASHVRVLRAGASTDAAFGDSKGHLEEETLVYQGIDAYQCEVDAMVASILDGARPVLSLADSRGNIATLVSLYQSAREGTAVGL